MEKLKIEVEQLAEEVNGAKTEQTTAEIYAGASGDDAERTTVGSEVEGGGQEKTAVATTGAATSYSTIRSVEQPQQDELKDGSGGAVQTKTSAKGTARKGKKRGKKTPKGKAKDKNKRVDFSLLGK